MNLTFFKNTKVLTLTLFFTCLVIFNLWLNLLQDKNGFLNYFFNFLYSLLYILGGVYSLLGAIQFDQDSKLRKIFIFFGLGLTSWGVGGLIWAYYNLMLKVEVPYPSLADFGFLLFIPFCAVAMFYLISLYKESINMRVLFETIFFAILAIIVIVGIINRPNLSSDSSMLTNVLNLLYPVGDVIILTTAFLTFRVSGGKIRLPLLILCLGNFSQVVADILFGYRTSHNIYWNGDISDLLYAVSAFIITFSLLNIMQNFSTKQVAKI